MHDTQNSWLQGSFTGGWVKASRQMGQIFSWVSWATLSSPSLSLVFLVSEDDMIVVPVVRGAQESNH